MLDYRCPVCATVLPGRHDRIHHECRTVSSELIRQAEERTVPSFELMHAEASIARNGWGAWADPRG